MTTKSLTMRQSRRAFLYQSAAAAAIAVIAPAGLRTALAAAPTWQDAIKKITGGTKPTEGKVTLNLPEIAENGNTVPFSVAVDSPMTAKSYVKAVHIYATGNPNPEVATFYFSPTSGKAAATSRMRLSQTQDVVALVEMSDGKFYQGRKNVKVTIGGCGG